MSLQISVAIFQLLLHLFSFLISKINFQIIKNLFQKFFILDLSPIILLIMKNFQKIHFIYFLFY